MLATDFFNQPYFAEVLKTPPAATEDAANLIERLIRGKWNRESLVDNDEEITILHGHVASPVQFHRSLRLRTHADGAEIQIPRTEFIRNKEHFLYDLLVVRRRQHVLVAVPFHALATSFFLTIDKALAGSRSLYETVNITKMVINLGLSGRTVRESKDGIKTQLLVTRCHLAFSDPATRRRDLQQVRLTGSDVGASHVYSQLVESVISPEEAPLVVTPILLGFALEKDGVRKSSATTDRHGNFKVTVGPGLRQVVRLFALLDEIEKLHDVVSTTSNVPILQSTSIKEAD